MGERGKFPDVLTYDIADAVSVFNREGISPRVICTSPRENPENGPFRVVRQQLAPDGETPVLTVAAEDWGKEV